MWQFTSICETAVLFHWSVRSTAVFPWLPYKAPAKHTKFLIRRGSLVPSSLSLKSGWWDRGIKAFNRTSHLTSFNLAKYRSFLVKCTIGFRTARQSTGYVLPVFLLLHIPVGLCHVFCDKRLGNVSVLCVKNGSCWRLLYSKILFLSIFTRLKCMLNIVHFVLYSWMVLNSFSRSFPWSFFNPRALFQEYAHTLLS